MCDSYDFNYLTREHIELMHSITLEEFGGEEGYYNYTIDRIESILAQQFPYFGVEKYSTLFHKAAMLMYFFTKGHCFVDGNKRVGIQSAIVFLDVNGYEDNLDDMEGYSKAYEISELKLSGLEIDTYIENLAEWLSERFSYL